MPLVAPLLALPINVVKNPVRVEGAFLAQPASIVQSVLCLLLLRQLITLQPAAAKLRRGCGSEAARSLAYMARDAVRRHHDGAAANISRSTGRSGPGIPGEATFQIDPQALSPARSEEPNPGPELITSVPADPSPGVPALRPDTQRNSGRAFRFRLGTQGPIGLARCPPTVNNVPGRQKAHGDGNADQSVTSRGKD